MNELREMKVTNHGKECSINRLKSLCGMQVEVSINTHTHDNKVMATYTYDEFNYENEESVLCLFDSKDESLNTRIDKALIIGVFHISEDIYNDVIEIYTNDFILSVTSLESKPTSLLCDYCKEEIERYEDYYSNQFQFGFGSKNDGKQQQIDLHWRCVDKVFSNILPSLKEDFNNSSDYFM